MRRPKQASEGKPRRPKPLPAARMGDGPRAERTTQRRPFSLSSLPLIGNYKFLFIVMCLAIPLGIYESRNRDLPMSLAEVPLAWFADKDLNLPQTLIELYPYRSFGFFLRSYQAGMCWENNFELDVCQTFPYRDLRDVREALDIAVALGGSKDQEQLFHFRAFILAKVGEPPEVVNAAVAEWRKHYPNSQRPDPRSMVGTNQP